MGSDGFVPTGQRLGYRLGRSWRRIRRFERWMVDRAEAVAGSGGGLLARITVVLFLSAAVMISFWMMLFLLFMALAVLLGGDQKPDEEPNYSMTSAELDAYRWDSGHYSHDPDPDRSHLDY